MWYTEKHTGANTHTYTRIFLKDTICKLMIEKSLWELLKADNKEVNKLWGYCLPDAREEESVMMTDEKT